MSPRWRFRRDREDADESGMSLAHFWIAWDCPRCGEENVDGERFCKWCKWDHHMGSWLCDCGHLNPDSEEECQMCGREKAEP